MKEKFPVKIEKYRLKKGPLGSDANFGFNGAFVRIPYKKQIKINVVVSDQCGWDHVSVSIENKNRTPTWNEMCFIKRLFFDDSETVIQYHPPEKDNINVHNYTLHLWRPQNEIVPIPPKVFV